MVGFEHEGRRPALLLDEMRERLQKFALSLHPEKTPDPSSFGRFAAERRQRAGGLGKPENLQLPGLHLHLRQDPHGQIPDQKEDPAGPAWPGEAQDD